MVEARPEHLRDFARRLKAAREKTGLTQEQLAGRLGASVWAVRHWEKADYLPTNLVYKAEVEKFIAGVESGRITPTVKPKRWTRLFAACRTCGKTERKHQGLGYCTGCYESSPEVRARNEKRRAARRLLKAAA